MNENTNLLRLYYLSLNLMPIKNYPIWITFCLKYSYFCTKFNRMTIDIANNLRMSFGLSFDEVISILGLHYGKTEWVVDDEIRILVMVFMAEAD